MNRVGLVTALFFLLNTVECIPFQPRIVGGTAVSAPLPWLARLKYEGKHECGATVLNSRWVLTAAHCVADEDQGKLEDDAYDLVVEAVDGAKSSKIQKIILHNPPYDPFTMENDIALLYLRTPIVLSSYATIDASKSSTLGVPGKNAVVVGWGATVDGGNTSSTLRSVTVPIVDTQFCSDLIGDTPLFPSNLCAGAKGRDACKGDSGGPLLSPVNGTYIQIGITSWGLGCGSPDVFGVYTRVSSFAAWIKKLTGAATWPS